MTLTRWCCIFLGIALVASLIASMIGRPEYFWLLAMIGCGGAAWYVTKIDPLKGLALALMGLRAAFAVLYDMGGDFASTFLDRYRGRYSNVKQEMKEME